MSRRVATSLTITDPLVKYQSLVATGVYSPDLAQHRLAHHLQKLYTRLKDYTPAAEYRARLRQIAQTVESVDGSSDAGEEQLAIGTHPIRRNPFFARFFQKTEGRDSLALTRLLTSRQAALEVNSPRGLFLSGEVGTGKSMLLDLLADGLPTNRKRRWHFNTFMLHALSRLEQFRKSYPRLDRLDQEYSLMWMAKEMIEQSPILFLDEFQLPDRAASKLLNNLFIAFFQLGGVLVASSNRMPEELAKATGYHYTPPPTGGLIEQVLGLGKRSQSGELFGQTSDFAAFLEVLKARCDFWHIEGTRDWRRKESGSGKASALPVDSDSPLLYSDAVGLASVTSGEIAVQNIDSKGLEKPAKYFLPTDSEECWTKSVLDGLPDVGDLTKVVQWQPRSLVVYGRKVTVPRQRDGVTYWLFDELVSSFGPADYITLASNYHTFIIDRVPVLTVSLKNEARRFITFLDALYESRCKLILRADASPDNLFFPDARGRLPDTTESTSKQDEGGDATYSETISEVFQDQLSPFRPNISTYSDSTKSKYNPDQDSDFGLELPPRIDFGNAGAFTGEDERFAYKRAASRLWELCSLHWHAREGEWWQPLGIEARHWEGSEQSAPLPKNVPQATSSEITMGQSTELDEPAGLERFRLAALRKETG